MSWYDYDRIRVVYACAYCQCLVLKAHASVLFVNWYARTEFLHPQRLQLATPWQPPKHLQDHFAMIFSAAISAIP
jgi:hypothetical protein